MTDEQTKNAVDKKFKLYDSAEACAGAAAPIFAANKWKWTMCGVPDKAEILETLEYLEREATDDYCETGRLIFYKGQYGHLGSQVIFDEKLKDEVTKALINLKPKQDLVIYGYEVEGILNKLEDRNFYNAESEIDFGLATPEGHWTCRIKKQDLPDDLNDFWIHRVVVIGKATFRKNKPLIEVETYKILPKKPALDEAVKTFVENNKNLWEGQNTTEYLEFLRDQD